MLGLPPSAGSSQLFNPFAVPTSPMPPSGAVSEQTVTTSTSTTPETGDTLTPASGTFPLSNPLSTGLTTEPSSKAGLGTGGIVGIAVGSVVGVLIVGASIFLFWTRRQKQEKGSQRVGQVETTMNDDPEIFSPQAAKEPPEQKRIRRYEANFNPYPGPEDS